MLQNNIDENEASLLFKFILIGDVAVGKTSLLKQFVEKRFCDDYNLTIGVEFNIKYIQVNDHVIKLQMWDTSGQENFKSVTRLYYRAAAGAIMVFDITRRETFENIRNWHREALDNGNSRMKFLLIGNKTDLQNQREVESYEAAQYAKENECLYIECSALQGSNVENAFMELAHQIYQMAMEDPNLVNEQYGIKYVNNANSSMSTSKIVSQNAIPKKQLQKVIKYRQLPQHIFNKQSIEQPDKILIKKLKEFNKQLTTYCNSTNRQIIKIPKNLLNIMGNRIKPIKKRPSVIIVVQIYEIYQINRILIYAYRRLFIYIFTIIFILNLYSLMINDNRNPAFFQQPNQNQYNIILPNNNQPVIAQRQAYPNQPITQPILQQPLQFQPQFPLPPQVNYIPQTIQSKPNVLPTVYQEKPTQVINMDEIEAPWRLKCATLERQILELQIQLRKGPGPSEPDAIEVIDDTRLRELDSKKAQLQQMIQDRDREISELENQIHQQQESIEIQIQERTVHYSNEIETWQKRFQQLERDYSQSQRQLQDLQEEQKRLEKQNQDGRTSQQRVGQSRNY